MVLNACAEFLYRTIFSLFGFFVENWLITLLMIFIISAIVKKLTPLVIGIIASIMDLAVDFLFSVTFGTSAPLTVFVSIAIGILWASIILFSPINPIIKLINMPFMFLIGLIWGFIPIPIPIALILGFLMRYKTTNYIIAITPSILIILLVYIVGTTIGAANICSGFNFVLS